MKEFESKDYQVFNLFNREWGLVTAGKDGHFNTCTIGWGSLGTIWGPPNRGKPIVTVYINPSRYTWQFLKESDYFTVSFFPKEYRNALAYLGSHSGRDKDKVAAAGLTPTPMGKSQTYKEANLTFLCKKLYQGGFDRAGMSEEIQDIYVGWEPHWMFIGEILEVDDKR